MFATQLDSICGGGGEGACVCVFPMLFQSNVSPSSPNLSPHYLAFPAALIEVCT